MLSVRRRRSETAKTLNYTTTTPIQPTMEQSKAQRSSLDLNTNYIRKWPVKIVPSHLYCHLPVKMWTD